MELCQQAQAGADQQAAMNVMGHVTETHGAGENLYYCHPGLHGNTGPERTACGTDGFYEEVNDYFDCLDHKTKIPETREGYVWGHYTQVIRKDTFEMGVGFTLYTDIFVKMYSINSDPDLEYVFHNSVVLRT